MPYISICLSVTFSRLRLFMKFGTDLYGIWQGGKSYPGADKGYLKSACEAAGRRNLNFLSSFFLQLAAAYNYQLQIEPMSVFGIPSTSLQNFIEMCTAI